MPENFFDEFLDDEPVNPEIYKQQRERQKNTRKYKRKVDTLNEVGKAPEPSPEILAERQAYLNDFVLMHQKVFPESTGVKPFGRVQVDSIYKGQDIFHHGGRLLKLEPRGYAKTTRITNETLFCSLCGLQDYIVIVCSNLTKANEILDSMLTELYGNDKLLELFPATIACFRHLENSPLRARHQTYDGEPSYIKQTQSALRMPYIEGEPSAGKWIEVRPLSNLKGLNHKAKKGPDAGKVYRPTLLIFDDPQTFDEAMSPTSVKNIINLIKRDGMNLGGHSKRVSAIMSITPVCVGDVAYHFEKEEVSWDRVRYGMVTKFPDRNDLWMNEYAKILLNYDRDVRGSRIKAALEARKYVEENWDILHAGSEVTWDHAYAWNEEPQTEVSALQHAYNIIINDGEENFQLEYQCNVEYGLYEEGETIHASREQILSKTTPYPRKTVPQDCPIIVAHIDVNMDLLSYMAVCSARTYRPHVLDYGVYPGQPGEWSKRNLAVSLRSQYPNIHDYREVLYLAVLDLIAKIATTDYIREDGAKLRVSQIGIDIKYEEDYISRAVRDSPFRGIVVPTYGMPVGPDDELLHNRTHPEGSMAYHNCVLRPNRDRALDYFWVDSSFFKTEVHKAFNKDKGIAGSLTLFQPAYTMEHVALANHCNIEYPYKETGKKTDRTRILWTSKAHQIDNEYFDNLYNCFALLCKQGISFLPTDRAVAKSTPTNNDIQDWMNSQKGMKL